MANSPFEPKYQIFRDMLTRARTNKGMLQSEVADKLGRNQAFVSKYERGERRIDLPEFLEIAEVLEIDVTAFVLDYTNQLRNARSDVKT
ncbi:helix-turn-helix domain-containing protein [Duganella sp. FT80W]|uniref:Helix-turn-helix domain-containing protein n=1 Tax=Duganella guangzhouensis TaxID=2666084 RepID=A0A6I2LA64_9BURK|nr:helix-turn-helix transcriptional regulator [Duganella guangzhouensis]MRW94898.1 helix-turn-helix domain-containing protein [Duganella guangzhouensis]